MTRLLLAVPALIAVAALAGAAAEPPAAARAGTATAADTLTVTGTGTAKAVPDEAELSFGIETRGVTAQAALAANGGAMQKLIAALRASGARDVATQWVSVYPVSQEDGSIRGFSASNSVSATIGVAKAGALVDAAVAAGANQVSGPGLSSTAAERLYEEALGAAVATARAHAEVLAKASGRTLGAVTAIVEGGAEAMPVYRAAAADSESTPIVPGSQETTASATVTFALR
jgi:uncharacterized protein YggE